MNIDGNEIEIIECSFLGKEFLIELENCDGLTSEDFSDKEQQ